MRKTALWFAALCLVASAYAGAVTYHDTKHCAAVKACHKWVRIDEG